MLFTRVSVADSRLYTTRQDCINKQLLLITNQNENVPWTIDYPWLMFLPWNNRLLTPTKRNCRKNFPFRVVCHQGYLPFHTHSELLNYMVTCCHGSSHENFLFFFPIVLGLHRKRPKPQWNCCCTVYATSSISLPKLFCFKYVLVFRQIWSSIA